MDSRPPEDQVDDDRARQIGALLNAFIDRRASGSAESPEAFLAAHPEFADELRAELALAISLRVTVDSLSRLIRAGQLESADDPDFPARLGEYRIRRVLGRGGMGVVLEALDPALRRPVALKLLRPEFLADDLALTRFQREARLAANLDDPHIVKVHAFDHAGDSAFIAMEYLAGPSLAEVLHRHGGLPVPLVADLLRQLLQGLAAAHKAELVHRDIKPSNLLLTGDPLAAGDDAAPPTGSPGGFSPVTLKIADFGLARMAQAMTRVTAPGARPGTPAYMSPEQTQSLDVDSRSDLFSCGVVLHEMLSGKRPFDGDSSAAVLHQVLHAEPPDLRAIRADVPAVLATVCRRLLAKRPADRFASAEEALAALAAARPVRTPERDRKIRRVLARVAAAAAVVASLSLAYAALTGDPPPIVTAETEMRMEADGERRYSGALLVSRRGRSEMEALRVFEHVHQPFSATTLVALPDGGHPLLVAGTFQVIDGSCVFALDRQLRRIPTWRLDLNDARTWPDCQPSGAVVCTGLIAGDLDGRPGDELVVVAGEGHQYPTRISIVDPRAPAVLSTYWHPGGINQVLISRDLVPGRPLLVACGINNLLDGRGKPAEGDSPALTRWDKVPAVWILDPADMDGVGPHPLAGLDLPLASHVAYGYFDLSASGLASLPEEGRLPRPAPALDDVLQLESMWLETLPDEADPRNLRECVTLSVSRLGGEPHAAQLRFGPRLELLGDKMGNPRYWSSVWKQLPGMPSHAPP